MWTCYLVYLLHLLDYLTLILFISLWVGMGFGTLCLFVQLNWLIKLKSQSFSIFSYQLLATIPQNIGPTLVRIYTQLNLERHRCILVLVALDSTWHFSVTSFLSVVKHQHVVFESECAVMVVLFESKCAAVVVLQEWFFYILCDRT